MTEPTSPAAEPTPEGAPPTATGSPAGDAAFGAPTAGTSAARGGGAPAFAMPDWRAVARMDLSTLVLGILLFVLSLALPYYGASARGFNVSASINAWHSWNVLALLLALVATLVIAVQVFADTTLPSLPVGYRWVAAGLAALGLLIFIIRTFTLPHGDAGLGVSYGLRWGAWVDLILFVLFTGAAVLAAREGDGLNPMQRPTTTTAPPA